MKPVEAKIHAKLTEAFTPVHLEVVNESHKHSVPPGSESHFNVMLVAAQFANQRQVARHQAVYAALAEELQAGVHALALHTHSPDEWQTSQSIPDTPPCLGGGKRA